MKPNEPIQFTCFECLTTFDICVAPRSEWPETGIENDGNLIDIGVSTCPFCGSTKCKAESPAENQKRIERDGLSA